MGRGFDAERPSDHVEPIVGKAIKPAPPTSPMTRDVYVHAGAIATLDGGGSGPLKGPGHDVSDHTLPAGHGFVIEDGRFTAIALGRNWSTSICWNPDNQVWFIRMDRRRSGPSQDAASCRVSSTHTRTSFGQVIDPMRSDGAMRA